MSTDDDRSVASTPDGTPKGEKKRGTFKRLGRALKSFFSSRKEKKDFLKADKNSDGKLTLNEWMQTMNGEKDPIGYSLLTLFHFDKAEDGRLTEDDFHHYRAYLHEVQKRRRKLRLGKYRVVDSMSEAEDPHPASEETLQFDAPKSLCFSARARDPLEELEENFLNEERDHLASFLQAEDGRARFSKWLFNVADQDKSHSVSRNELTEFLRVLHGDGISPESLYENDDDDASLKSSNCNEEDEESVEDSDKEDEDESLDSAFEQIETNNEKLDNLARTPTDALYLATEESNPGKAGDLWRGASRCTDNNDEIDDGEATSLHVNRKISQSANLEQANHGRRRKKSADCRACAVTTGECSLHQEREIRTKKTLRSYSEEELDKVSGRIMSQYDLTHSGELNEEEFSVLADIVGREYQLNQIAQYTGLEIGDYRIIRTVGRGAVGTVKYAVHKKTGDRRAVKIMRRGEEEVMKRLIKEIQVMKMLDHLNVIHVYEVLESSHFIFIFMEFAAGGKLNEHFAVGKPIVEDMARFYFKQLIEGVTYIHSLNVAHRDLKLDNLMLGQHGNLKIGDFGHAGLFKPGWDIFSTMTVGSLSHLSPEQVTGSPYSGQAIDVWSCGVILYQMLTGELPFEGESVESLMDSIKNGDFVQPKNISSDALSLIKRMLTVDSEARPAAGEILQDNWLTGEKRKLTLLHCELVPEGLPEDSEFHAFVWDAATKILVEKGISVRQKGDIIQTCGKTTFVGHSARCRHLMMDVRFSMKYGLKFIGAKPHLVNNSSCVGLQGEKGGASDSSTNSVVQDGIVVGVGAAQDNTKHSRREQVGRSGRSGRSKSELWSELRDRERKTVPVLELDLKHGDAWVFQKFFRHLVKYLECRMAKRRARQEKDRMKNELAASSSVNNEGKKDSSPVERLSGSAAQQQQPSYADKPPLHGQIRVSS